MTQCPFCLTVLALPDVDATYRLVDIFADYNRLMEKDAAKCYTVDDLCKYLHGIDELYSVASKMPHLIEVPEGSADCHQVINTLRERCGALNYYLKLFMHAEQTENHLPPNMVADAQRWISADMSTIIEREAAERQTSDGGATTNGGVQ